MKVIEHVPIVISQRAAGFTADETLNLSAERCMDVLMHPVPLTDMFAVVGVNRPGRRMIIEWPKATQTMPYLSAGDVVEVNSETYLIAGVREYPHVYTEIYIAD
jgi:hypothetical protein